MNDAKDDQARLRSNLGEIKRAQKQHLSKESRNARDKIELLYIARKSAVDFLDDFTSRVSEARHQAKQGTGLKILTFKQRLQRLPIALPQIKAGNNSENLLNEIRQIVYSLYQSKPIKVKYKMDTIFMNSGNSRTSQYHALVLQPTDKSDLRRGQKVLLI